MIGIGEGQTRPRRKWHLRNDSRRIYMSLSVEIDGGAVPAKLGEG